MSRWKKGKLSYILYSLVAMVLVVGLFVCLSMIKTINASMNESATSNLLSTTKVISGTLEEMIEKDYDPLRIVGTLYANDGTPSTPQLDAFQKTMGLDWLGVIDADGQGADCFGNHFNLKDYPESEAWDLTHEGYSNAYTGMLSGRSQITLWIPVYHENRYLGAVLGNVLLTRYYSADVFTFYSGDGRTYVIDSADGSWIIRSLGADGASVRQKDIYSLLTSSGNSPQEIEEFRKVIEKGESGTAVFNFNGQLAYICFLQMPSSPGWHVTTVISKDILLRESADVQRMIRWVLIILCAVFIVTAGLLISWFVRRAKIHEIGYREVLFGNISANLDSSFLIYEKNGGRTAYVSENTKRIFGLDRKWLKENAENLFDWCGIPAEDPEREAFLSGGLKAPAVREVSVENELGQTARTIRLELIPADLGQELAVLTDITADKDIQKSLVEAMNRAEAASRAKNEFMSAMSHDLRTPINGIVGMTTIAAAHLEDKNRVQDCLGKISESTAHLLSLINEVLDMGQFESGKIELARESFNIAELLQNVLSVNYPGIQQKNHTVKVHIHMMEHERVIGDPVRITRIATNLISNAIKYTPSGGLITLTLQEKEELIEGYGCYELMVQDNGMGMSPQFLDKLFEPFEREEDVKLSRIQGTGLGLSIVKNMVELMMGTIKVESEKNKGTTFRITVNLKLDRWQEEEAVQLAGLPVLVVDDDVESCKNVTGILQSIGMQGEWTDNGAQAVEMVDRRHRRREDYLAVILDWRMPDMDGVETARRIRAKVGREVPIIILTAYEWSEIEAQAREAGVDAFITKPLFKSKLLRKMTEITEGNLDAPQTSVEISSRSIPKGRRVLLAEDNELNMEIAVEILQMMGIEADWVGDGEAAVKRFEAAAPGTYHMILMDIQMPKMNGYEATRAIRKSHKPQGRTIPIVAMTADAFKRDESSAKAAGMDEFLTKPISIERLSQTLKRFLGNEKDM